jgi:hypothetical protein
MLTRRRKRHTGRVNERKIIGYLGHGMTRKSTESRRVARGFGARRF